MLKALSGVGQQIDEQEIERRVRGEVVQKLTGNLMKLMNGTGALDLASLAAVGPAPEDGLVEQGGDYMAPWIDTEQCTACDECTMLNGKIFVYDDQKKAIIKDATAGPYSDLVKAAEKCTAQIIHPGLPASSEKDVEKWVKRGEKFN